MKRITLYFLNQDHAPDKRTLQGRRVGYGFNPPEDDRAVFRVWADDTTFGVPFERVISFEIDERKKDG